MNEYNVNENQLNGKRTGKIEENLLRDDEEKLSIGI